MVNLKTYYNTEDVFLTRNSKLNESNKVDLNLVPGIPINQKLKYNQEQLIKAVQYGMIVLINYRGDKDKWRGGRERVIVFMNVGKNRNTGNILARGWHLDGYSVGVKSNVEKVWRLFKVENIISMTFTGDFVRLPPKGYKMNDRVMTETTYVRADFNEIRRNQFRLVQQGKLKDVKDNEISDNTSHTYNIEIKNTNTILNLSNIWNNSLFKKTDNSIKISFMKSVIGNDYIAILGAMGTVGRTVKLLENKKTIGTYMCIGVIPDIESKNNLFTQLSNLRNVKNVTEFKLYYYVKKL